MPTRRPPVQHLLEQLDDDTLHLAVADGLVDERDVLAQSCVRDARAVREALQVLLPVHAHAERDADVLVHRARAPEELRGGRRTTLAVEVRVAEGDEELRAALSNCVAELSQRTERARGAVREAEVDDGRHRRRRDLLHARDGVHCARRVERVVDRGPDEREDRLQVRCGERAAEEGRELLLNDLPQTLLELVLERTEVERLAEHVEVTRSEERKNLQRVNGRTAADESQGAVRDRSVIIRSKRPLKTYFTA